MKSREEIMNMLEAFDLAGSLRGAGELAGVSHHTVARYVAERDGGELAGDGPRRRGADHRSVLGEDRGVGRAVARQDPRRSLPRQAEGVGVRGFGPDGASGGGGGQGQPSPWSAAGVSAVDRRAWDVGAVGLGHRSGHRGPKDESVLCVVGVVEVPGSGAVLGSQVGDGDRLCRPGDEGLRWCTDVLVDRQRAHRPRSTTSRGCRSGIRRWSRSAVTTGSRSRRVCRRDPESKGGSEATVRVAKADLVPTDANLRGDCTSWAELVDACEAWMAEVNGREHRVTRRAPVEMLLEEQQRLHRLPEAPYTAVLGETRKVSWSSTISFGGVTYSVPHTLADETVWVRVDGDHLVVTRCAPSGPIEVARHQRSTPGHPMIDDAHYPPRPAGPLGGVRNRRARPRPSSAPSETAPAPGSLKQLLRARPA